MICPTCDRETAAVAELGGGADNDMSAYRGGRLRKRCGHLDCKAVLPEEHHARLPAGIDPRGVAVQTTFGPNAVAHSAAANGAPPSFVQIVAQSEARLLQVRERIAELRSLETEEKQLVLILTAAGKPPKEVKPS